MERPPEHEPTKTEATPGEDDSSWGDVSIRRIQIFNLCILGIATLVSLQISQGFAIGVVAGGLLMAANFNVVVLVIRAVFTKAGVSVLNVGLYWVKFAGIMLLVGVLVVMFRIDVIGLLLGLSTILIAIILEAVLRMVGI